MNNLLFKIEGGELRINVWDLLATATDEERETLINALSCNDRVIEEVGNQIVDGYTSDGSFAGKSCIATADTYGGIDRVLRRIAKASGDIAAKEIARLEDAVRCAQELGQKGWDAYHRLAERRS